MYVTVTSYCVACKVMITFNPDHVPSIRVNNTGKKQPLCKACFHRWNQIHRVSKGLEPIQIHPKAYEPKKGGLQ